MEITRHRYATGTYRGQLETLWGSRIAEIEIYGEVVTRDAPYINKSALQMNAGSKDQLSAWANEIPLHPISYWAARLTHAQGRDQQKLNDLGHPMIRGLLQEMGLQPAE